MKRKTAIRNTYICSYCGKPFERKATEIRTNTPCCSWTCSAKFRKFGTEAKDHLRKPNNAICAVCGKEFHRPPSHLARVNVTVCSHQCNGVLRGEEWKKHAHKGRAAWTEETRRNFSVKRSGSGNPSWKGGITYRKRKGNYPVNIRYVACPSEFSCMARKDGYVMEHRLIMAVHLGRALERTEVVHHINHDPTDNRLENLQLFASNAEHKRHEGQTGYFKAYYRNRTNRHNSE